MTLFDEIVAPYWSTDTANVIEEKIREEQRYKARLREVWRWWAYLWR
jgi:hypothetical protein